jgi:D-sedoheptulose 7-phosphate isomerase
MEAELAAAFRQVAANMERVADGPYVESLARAVDLFDQTFRSGHKLLVFGNGGSAADAQHLTAELVGRFAAFRRPLPAIALTTNQAFLTAWSNDRSFEEIFSRQVEALGEPGDLACALSTSGLSPNITSGLRTAREMGLGTVALTGQAGGELGGLCDVLLAVPLVDTPRIQEVHLVTYHLICAALEQRIMARGTGAQRRHPSPR